ncbi:MAG: nuclear transport factor 2 family protein [Streptosporangiaceae bacterium]
MTKPATPDAGAAGQPKSHPVSASHVVDQYLTAVYSGNFDQARPVVADGFSFQGPFLQVDGKEAFFEGAEGLKPIVRGHRLLRQWADGEEVCSWYEVNLETPAGSGQVLMSEWHTVRGGQLISGRVVFDTGPFRAMVPEQ